MFGVYIHIPFCLQRCRYCDFATYSVDQIAVNTEYVDTLLMEIQKQKNIFGQQPLDTVYFGGGTPSLLDPAEIKRLLKGLNDEGFTISSQTEVTLEMNPATLDEDNVTTLLDGGVNRISVGAQTFSDDHLKNCGRKHSALQTRETVKLLQKLNVDFSMDLLFALPNQTLAELREDLNIFVEIDPDHISPYCLTLPGKHPMNTNRPSEGLQTEMFSLIWDKLETAGYQRYEISNFAKPGKESRHNNLYWKDENYWGLGLSAHSYKAQPGWGSRFWNPSDYNQYLKTIKGRPQESSEVSAHFPGGLREDLQKHQSLTDYCHTSLRTREGLEKNSLRQKFGADILTSVSKRAQKLVGNGLLEETAKHWTLSSQGVLLSNPVFEHFLFLADDIDNPPRGPIIRN